MTDQRLIGCIGTAVLNIGSAIAKRFAVPVTSLTIPIMRKHAVKLHGHHCQISVHREGKHARFAVGDYLGQEIRVQSESEGAAVKRWRETASTTVATEMASRE